MADIQIANAEFNRNCTVMLLSQHKIRRYFPLCKGSEKRSWKYEYISRDRPCFAMIQISLLRLKKAVVMNIDMTDDH